MASILDVAREAKVAPSTVSLVMNHRGRVSDETRKRVDAVIRRLGYRGRGTRMEEGAKKADETKASRFGFIYTTDALLDGSESTYCRELIQGVEQSLSGTGITLNIMRGQSHVDQDFMFQQHLDNQELDGLLVFGPSDPDGYVERILQTGVPLVLFNRPVSYGRHSCVNVDYYQGGRLAMDHLLSLGHERVGIMIRCRPPHWTSGGMILEGYLKSLREHGLEPTLDIEMTVDWSEQDMRDACKQMIDAGVTAILLGDVHAVSAANALERLGVSVPNDISVMGFDGRGLVSESGLVVTSIAYDRVHMGRMAGRMLQKFLRPDCGVSWLGGAVRTHFKPGQTTAGPPSTR